MNKIIAKQTHSSIVKIVDRNTPLWIPCDGMISTDVSVALIVYGADCAMIAFWDDEQIGICHAGWRGFVEGVIQNTMEKFTGTMHCHISPFLHEFEITRDACYEAIYAKYKDRYFRSDGEKIIFEFKRAILDVIGPIPYTIDDRSTIEHPTLASFRRDKKKGNGTQNRLVVWRDIKNVVQTKLFYPKENIILWPL